MMQAFNPNHYKTPLQRLLEITSFQISRIVFRDRELMKKVENFNSLIFIPVEQILVTGRPSKP